MIHITRNTTQYLENETGELVFHVGKESSLVLFDTALEDGHLERSVAVFLEGEGARVELYGIFFGYGKQSFTLSHTVLHLASHTSSKLVTRGTLSDEAKTDYRALIDIPKGSVACSGEQSEHTLLLSEKALITALPALKIANNDVKASHSVATTYIDVIKKFYLESRGLSEVETIKAMVAGHFSAVLDRMQNEEFRMQIEKTIEQRING